MADLKSPDRLFMKNQAADGYDPESNQSDQGYGGRVGGNEEMVAQLEGQVIAGLSGKAA